MGIKSPEILPTCLVGALHRAVKNCCSCLPTPQPPLSMRWRRNSLTASGIEQANGLGRALNVRMTNWFETTADSYFNHQSAEHCSRCGGSQGRRRKHIREGSG